MNGICAIERPGKSAIEKRLGDKYTALIARVYRYRQQRNFTLSCAAGEAADVVLSRLAALNDERKVA